MSRTDKDTPWWVTATWWKPDHWRCDRAHEAPGRRWMVPGKAERSCDLPPMPVVSGYDRTSRFRHCEWIPDWPTHRGYRNYKRGVPRWFVEAIWNSPTRRQVRDDCRQAVKEHRATGEVETIPPIDQHRQCAGWLWW